MLPFSGRTPATKHASYTGAKCAEPGARSQAGRLLALYRICGVTDHEAADALGLPLSTINARRNYLFDLGLIEAESFETKQWKTGQTRRVVWTAKQKS